MTTTSISLLLSSLTSPATVCLWTDEEQCQQVPVVHHHLLPHKLKQPLQQAVESIPVVWQGQDASGSIYQDNMGAEVWTWLMKMTSLSDPVLWFVNTAVVLLLVILVIRCTVCLLPKCRKD